MKILLDYRLQSGGIGVYSRYILKMLNEIVGSNNVTLLVNEDNDKVDNPVLVTNIKPYSLFNFINRKTKTKYHLFFSPSYTFFNSDVDRRIMVVHDLAVLQDKNYFNNIFIKFFGLGWWKLYFYLLKFVTYNIYGISETTNMDIIHCWSKQPSGVLENIVAVGSAQMEPHEHIGLQPSVFYFGNSRNHKDLSRLFRIAEQNIDVNFILAGSCCEDETLNWLLPNVKRLGFLGEEELNSTMRNVDASILLSTYEGFGRGVVESLQHGTPVILTRGGALRELHDQGIITLDHDENFKIALNRAQYVKKYKIVNSAYWVEKYSYSRVLEKLGSVLK